MGECPLHRPWNYLFDRLSKKRTTPPQLKKSAGWDFLNPQLCKIIFWSMPRPKNYLFKLVGGCTPIPRKPAWVREGGRLKGIDPQAQKIILCSMHRTQNYFLSYPPKPGRANKKASNWSLCVSNDLHSMKCTCIRAQTNHNLDKHSCEYVSVSHFARALNAGSSHGQTAFSFTHVGMCSAPHTAVPRIKPGKGPFMFWAKPLLAPRAETPSFWK